MSLADPPDASKLLARDPSETFADPYIVCVSVDYLPERGCGGRVVWRNEKGYNIPCGHRAGFSSVCPSWGPVDGCRCDEMPGGRTHAPAQSFEAHHV